LKKFFDMLQVEQDDMNSNMVIESHPVQFVFCADTKALWLVLGLPQSASSAYCCPFCLIEADRNRRIPLCQRGRSHLRTLAEITYHYERYKDDKPLRGEVDKRDNGDYYNVTYEPLFKHNPNGPDLDDIPLLYWIVVPFLHIVIRVGNDMIKVGEQIAKELDSFTAKALLTSPCLISIRGIEAGTDYHTYIMSLKDGPQPLPTTGPVQDEYRKICEKQGSKGEVFFGNTLTGNGAYAFSKSDLTSFWRTALRESFVSTDQRQSLTARWKALDRLRSSFRKVVGLVGKNAPVTSPEELELGKQLVADFMTNYREILPTVPPKVHFLEDHCVKQAEYFGHWPGLYNEQGGESSHSQFNKFAPQYRSVGNSNTRSLQTVRAVAKSNRLTEHSS